jgi:hypothetical protein
MALPCAAQSPTMTLQLRPVEPLLADAEYVGRLLGQGTELDRITETVKKLLTLPGIDTKRHLGGYWIITEKPEPTDIVMMVPYQDEAKLLEQAATFGTKSQKQDDGSYVLKSDHLPSDLHVRFQNKYAYASFRGKDAVAVDKLVDPARVFDKDAQSAVLLTVRVDQIPRTLRQDAMQTFEQIEGLFQEDNPPPGLTKAQTAMFAQYMRFWVRVYRKLIFQTNTIEANLDIDRAKQVFSVGYRLQPSANTELARDMTELGKVKTRFGGFVRPDAVACGYLCFPYPQELKKFVEIVQKEMLGAKLKELMQDEKKANVLTDFLAEAAKLQGDRLDTGFVLSVNKYKKVSLVAGSQITNAATMEAEYKKLVQTLYPDKARTWLNVGKAGDVALHKNQMIDAKMLEGLNVPGIAFLVDHPGYNAYRDKEAYWSAGPMALEALQGALRAPLEEKEGGLYLQASVGRILEFFDIGGMARQKAFADDPEAGRVTYAILTGQGLRFEARVNASVVKFLMLMRKNQREF